MTSSRSAKLIELDRAFQQSGQGLVEYALIVVVVAIVLIISVMVFGEEIEQAYCQVAGELGGEMCGTASDAFCQDDFQNNEGWEFTRSGEDSWTFEDGEMCMSKNTYKDYAFNTCSQDLPTDDYVIRLSGAELTQGSGYGVFFRLQGVSLNPSGYAFQYDAGARGFVFRKWVDGHESTIRYKRAFDYDFYGEPHDIEVHVQGDTFDAYIDGELILTAQDSTYPTGSVGMGFRIWGNARACFNDLSIVPVPAED